jgi:hypothetical protein
VLPSSEQSDDRLECLAHHTTPQTNEDALELLVLAHEHVTNGLDALRDIVVGPLALPHRGERLQQPVIDHPLVEEAAHLPQQILHRSPLPTLLNHSVRPQINPSNRYNRRT